MKHKHRATPYSSGKSRRGKKRREPSTSRSPSTPKIRGICLLLFCKLKNKFFFFVFSFQVPIICNSHTGIKRRKKSQAHEESPNKAEIIKQLKSINIKLDILNMHLNTNDKGAKRGINQGGTHCLLM